MPVGISEVVLLSFWSTANEQYSQRIFSIRKFNILDGKERHVSVCMTATSG